MPETRSPSLATRHSPFALRTSRVLPWLLLALALGFFVWHASSSAFLQDDSYITYRYARNVVRGNGPVFNPGERVQGYTNFIWMILLSALGVVGIPFTTIIPLSQVLGVLCGCGVILLLFFIARRHTTGPPVLASAAVVLLAVNGAFAYWCVSGMETGIFSLLIAAAFFFYLREHTQRNLISCSVLLGLSALARPEGVLFLAVAAFDLLLRNLKGSLRNLLAAPALAQLGSLVLPFIAMVAPLYVWQTAYYGWLFPNTFYAKTGISVSYLNSGVKYLAEFYQAYGLWGLAFLVPLVLAIRKRKLVPGSPLLLAALALLIHALYTVAVGGDVLRIYRFFVPVLFLFYLFLTEGIWLAPVNRLVRVAVLLALVPLTFIGLLAKPRTVRADVKRNHILETGLVDKMSITGRWLNSQLGPDDWFTCTTIGAVSWYSDRNMIDMLGLTDAVIAHHPENILAGRLYWKERNYNTRHVLEKNPAYIYFSTGGKPSAAAERALFLRPRFRLGYYAYPVSTYHPENNGYSMDMLHKAKPGADTIPLEPVYDRPEFIDLYVDGINLGRRNRDSALVALRKCAEICPPDFGYVYEMMGQNALRMQPPLKDSAAWFFEQAVTRDEYCVSSQFDLGTIYARQGRLQDAMSRFRKVIEYAPYYYSAYVNLSVVAASLGDFAEAESVLARAADLFPGSPDIGLRLAYVRATVASSAGDFATAESALSEALRLVPDSPETVLRLAYARIQAGKITAAYDLLDDYLTRHPDDRNAAELLQRIRLTLQQDPVR